MPATRPRVVEDERGTDRRLGRQPRLERVDVVAGDDLDPAAGSAIAAASALGRSPAGSTAPAALRPDAAGVARVGAGRRRRGRAPVHRPEVERQLEPAPLPDQRAADRSPGRGAGRRRAPARRPAGDLGGPDRIAAVGRPQRLDGLVRALAGSAPAAAR